MQVQAPTHAVTRAGPGNQTATIYTCRDHLKATIRQLRMAGAKLTVTTVGDPVLGCKGCDARWHPVRRTRA
jgi:hypothetical protein